MERKMRFALVGAGVISTSHVEAISNNPLAELVAVCDIEKETAKQLAEANKINLNSVYGVIQGATSVHPGQETRFELHGNDGTIIFGDSGIKQWEIQGIDKKAPQFEGTASASNDPSNIDCKSYLE